MTFLNQGRDNPVVYSYLLMGLFLGTLCTDVGCAQSELASYELGELLTTTPPTAQLLHAISKTGRFSVKIAPNKTIEIYASPATTSTPKTKRRNSNDSLRQPLLGIFTEEAQQKDQDAKLLFSFTCEPGYLVAHSWRNTTADNLRIALYRADKNAIQVFDIDCAVLQKEVKSSSDHQKTAQQPNARKPLCSFRCNTSDGTPVAADVTNLTIDSSNDNILHITTQDGDTYSYDVTACDQKKAAGGMCTDKDILVLK